MSPQPTKISGCRFFWNLSLALACIAAVPTLLGVILAWDKPSTNVGTFIWWGPASQVYTARVDMGTALTGSVTGLKIGSTQYFTDTLYWLSNGIEGDFSAELVYVVPPDPTTNLVVRVDKADTLGAGWSNIFSLIVTNPQAQGFYRLVITNQVQ